MTSKRSKHSQRVLVTDRKYQGKYVAFNPAKGKRVIASGTSVRVAIRKAHEQGVDAPAIVFVPKEDVAYIY